jgi:hypothetical protein
MPRREIHISELKPQDRILWHDVAFYEVARVRRASQGHEVIVVFADGFRKRYDASTYIQVMA